MNKTKFLELVKNPNLIEEKDLTKLEELTSEHPYSQIIHILNVKGRKTFNKPEFEKALNLAATYCYDRNLLRSIIEGVSAVSETPAPASDAKAKEETTFETEESIFEEVSDFEWVNEDTDEGDEPFLGSATTPGKEVIEEEVTEKETTTGKQEGVEEQQEETEKDKAESSIQTKTDRSKKTDGKVKDKGKQIEKDAIAGEEQLDLEIEAGGIHAELMENLTQLQENKKKFKKPPKKAKDSKTRQEQIEILDNFIKNSPVLSKPNLSAESEIVSQDDLSKNSTKLNDELASENLARIYSKQGKRKEAEKIYKKLISKFPQKKAYFADQIDKLKKK